MPISLGELATQFGCELIGDPDIVIDNVASFANANGGSLTFLSSTAYKDQLQATEAAAVIVRAADAGDSPAAALIHDDPYACYARMAATICPPPVHPPGVHASVVVAASASVADSAHVAANVVIGERSQIGSNACIGPGCVIGPDCIVGEGCRLVASVTLARNVRMGARCMLHPGAVIGAMVSATR